MRFALLAALGAASAVAAPSTPVVAFLPPYSSDPQLQNLALLIESRASELVEETNKANQVHLKQAVRAIQEEGFAWDLREPKNADGLRQAIGADRAVSFTLEAQGANYVLAGVAVDGKKPKPFSVKLPKTWAGALEKGGPELAKALLAGVPLPKNLAAQPLSSNEEALQQLGACYPVVLKQPLSVDTPALVDTTELEKAAAACDRAFALDPKLRFAAATGALAHAILGVDTNAAKTLSALGETDDMLEIYTLARFWLLTRYQSNEAGVAFLQDVIKRHPNELLARSYLGDTQFALRSWADAEKTFAEYVAIAPNSPWAWGRLSKAQARQGRHDEAIAAAKKGFALSPTSPEARLELGSRLIDAGKLAEAEEILQPLSTLTPARGEHLLRLGWTHWLQGELDAAKAYFQRAVDVATSPGEWRTRGRAHYDLALVAAKQGKRDAAKAALKASLATGFRFRESDPLLVELVRELERPEAAPKGPPDAGPRGTQYVERPPLLPRESSLFPVDKYGDPDPNAAKPPPPNGLVLFRF
jgi:tetratricopeptide (TPR) repeat protein